MYIVISTTLAEIDWVQVKPYEFSNWCNSQASVQYNEYGLRIIWEWLHSSSCRRVVHKPSLASPGLPAFHGNIFFTCPWWMCEIPWCSEHYRQSRLTLSCRWWTSNSAQPPSERQKRRDFHNKKPPQPIIIIQWICHLFMTKNNRLTSQSFSLLGEW